MSCDDGWRSWVDSAEDRLGGDFFNRPTLAVACDLVGRMLHARTPDGNASGRIVEVEGYLGADDPASHAARLKRGPVLVMSGPPGIAYVYRSHGIHAMLNVVTEPAGLTGAVLIRALEPVTGIETMRCRRGLLDERLLCSGPGRLCQAMGVTLAHHGIDLVTSEEVWLSTGSPPTGLSASGRIGVSRGQDVLWRFFERGSRYVSAHRRGDQVSD